MPVNANQDNLKDYLVYMKDIQKLSAKTCNLRITAIRALLSYATYESVDITAIYVNSKAIKALLNAIHVADECGHVF